MALNNMAANNGGLYVTSLNSALEQFATWVTQDKQIGPLALQLMQTWAAAGAGVVLAKGAGSQESKLNAERENNVGDKEINGLQWNSMSECTQSAASICCAFKDLRCVGQLGRGAFGEVWHCEDVLDGKEYAVKAIPYRKHGDAGCSAGREAKMLASLDHPNILKYHSSWAEASAESPASGPVGLVNLPMDSDLGSPSLSYDGGSCGSAGVIFANTPQLDREDEDEAAFAALLTSKHTEKLANTDGHRCDLPAERGEQFSMEEDGIQTGTFYIQVELCEEETLHGWIAARNAQAARCSDEEVAREATAILAQCASGIAYLHKKSCVHRDVKPSNIFFGKDGKIRIGDFGLAKALDGCTTSPEMPCSEARPHTPNKQCSGTPSYASPEQRAGAPLGVETDVYSLGLVLVELICPVQTQMERAAVLEALRKDRKVQRPMSSQCEKLAKLAIRMTEPEPADRPSAAQIVGFLEEEEEDSKPTSSLPPPEETELSSKTEAGKVNSMHGARPQRCTGRSGRCLRRRGSNSNSHSSKRTSRLQAAL